MSPWRRVRQSSIAGLNAAHAGSGNLYINTHPDWALHDAYAAEPTTIAPYQLLDRKTELAEPWVA